jgi:hypothetical protein
LRCNAMYLGLFSVLDTCCEICVELLSWRVVGADVCRRSAVQRASRRAAF